MEILLDNNKDSFSFWKNLILTAMFFFFTPILLSVSLFSLYSLSKYDKTEEDLMLRNKIIRVSTNGVKVFASLPATFPNIKAEPVAKDARSEIVRQYLVRYNSPLENYADYIVQTADKYGLDFRLTTAIAQQESNLCKAIPEDSHNCWGWGIHSQGTLKFNAYENAINEVSRGLSENYIKKGYLKPEDIMKKYTPQSDGSWANGVSQFMSEME